MSFLLKIVDWPWLVSCLRTVNCNQNSCGHMTSLLCRSTFMIASNDFSMSVVLCSAINAVSSCSCPGLSSANPEVVNSTRDQHVQALCCALHCLLLLCTRFSQATEHLQWRARTQLMSLTAPRATGPELLQRTGVETQRQAEHLASFAREVMPVGCASGFCIMAVQGVGH